MNDKDNKLKINTICNLMIENKKNNIINEKFEEIIINIINKNEYNKDLKYQIYFP